MSHEQQYTYTPQPPPPKRAYQLKPNGKYPFSARTVLIPLLFYMIHIGLQSIAVSALTILAMARANAPLTPTDLINVVMQEQSWILLLSGIPQILTYSIALFVMNKRHQQYVLTRLPSFPEVSASALLTLGAIGGTTLILVLIQMLAGVSSFWDAQLDAYIELSQAFGDTSGMVLQVISIVILVPIAEELLFRGILCGELKRVMPDWAVILVSGAVFALIHGNVIQSTYVLLAGIILSAIYIWSGSIWLVIGMHSFYNLLGSTVPILLGANEQVMQWITTIEMICVPIGIVIAYVFYKKQKTRQMMEVR